MLPEPIPVYGFGVWGFGGCGGGDYPFNDHITFTMGEYENTFFGFFLNLLTLPQENAVTV